MKHKRKRWKLLLALGVACLAITAYGKFRVRRNWPEIDSIKSIYIALNDFDAMEYRDLKGYVPEKHWPELLAHFDSASYPYTPAKWEWLADMNIERKQCEDVIVHVYMTLDKVGCYMHGSYFSIPDERAFAADAERFILEGIDKSPD